MAAENERKFLVISHEWRRIQPISVADLTQGYLPQDLSGGTRLFINFNLASADAATIVISNDTDRIQFEARGESLPDIRKLEAWNKDTGEVTLTGRVEGRIRLHEGTDRIKAILAVKQYGRGMGNREECEGETGIDLGRQALRRFCEKIVMKKRYTLPFEKQKWEIDVYQGINKGLITADIEADHINAMLPGMGEDISEVPELRNQALAVHGVPDKYKLHL